MTNGNMITKLKGRDKERTKFLSTLNRNLTADLTAVNTSYLFISVHIGG